MLSMIGKSGERTSASSLLSGSRILNEEEIKKWKRANERYHLFIRGKMASVQPGFGNCRTQGSDRL